MALSYPRPRLTVVQYRPTKRQVYLDIARELLAGFEERFIAMTPFLIKHSASWEFREADDYTCDVVVFEFSGFSKHTGFKVTCRPAIAIRNMYTEFESIFEQTIESMRRAPQHL